MAYLIATLVWLQVRVWLAKVLHRCAVVFLALKWYRPQYWCCVASVRMVCNNVIIMEAMGEPE